MTEIPVEASTCNPRAAKGLDVGIGDLRRAPPDTPVALFKILRQPRIWLEVCGIKPHGERRPRLICLAEF